MQNKNFRNTDYQTELVVPYYLWPEIYSKVGFRAVLLIICKIIVEKCQNLESENIILWCTVTVKIANKQRKVLNKICREFIYEKINIDNAS